MLRKECRKQIEEVMKRVSRDQYAWCRDRGMYMMREDLLKRFESSVVVRRYEKASSLLTQTLSLLHKRSLTQI